MAKFEKDRDWLYNRYVVDRLSTIDIANELNTSSTTILRWLRVYGIERRTIAVANGNDNSILLTDRDWLYEQYITKNRSTNNIGDALGYSNVSIRNALLKHNIPIRNAAECKATHINLDYLNDKDWLYDQYVTKKRTAKEIGQYLGYFDGGTVNRKLDYFGIQKRTSAEIVMNNDHSLKLLNDVEWMYAEYITKNRSTVSISEELGCTHKTVLKYLRDHNIDVSYGYKVSGPEMEISEYLSDIGIEHRGSDRTVLKPLELDIYVANRNLAIELNGVYWHSVNEATDVAENKHKHQIKAKMCADLGISLMQFTCYEWKVKREIVKSMINNKLGICARIYARKCEVTHVNSCDEKQFFDANHIQGHVNSEICIGLKHDGEFVCMMSFRKPRFNNTCDYEILRIATKLNTSVAGGASRLFSRFLEIKNNPSVLSYADMKYSTGKIYKELGFELSHISDIGYRWVKNGVEYNRMQFQKHKLYKKLTTFDDSITAEQNMFNNGYRKLYDAGQYVFVRKGADR